MGRERIPTNAQNVEYTDVIVVGNGPSGISLSLLLSGQWPFYTSGHPDEYLNIRLAKGGQKSLIEQDLEFLSQGLEGRSSNPVALLFDGLTHPDADMGVSMDSLLRWEKQPEQCIPHVVLGRNKPGGAWQMMEGDMQTLSLGPWMQLPDLPINRWLCEYRREFGNSQGVSKDRASIQEIRTYYEQYTVLKGIRQYFRPGTTVTSVERVLDVCHTIDDESGEQNPCSHSHHGKHKWEVRGYETTDHGDGMPEIQEFCYRAPNVVLATGTYDLPNRLKVEGEHLPYILHSFVELEHKLQKGVLQQEVDPVVVVGAGLSAADAILCLLRHGISVVHIFRRSGDDPGIILHKLPKVLYPEYHQVQQMMQGKLNVDGYTCFSEHTISEFKDSNKVLVRPHCSSCDTIVSASHVLVLIGSRPDLSFLQHQGKHLGVVSGMAPDSKHNPIDIDPYTHQSIHESGLFAMGPLVGDNFVRFLRGGALAITSHLWRKRTNNL